MINRYSRQTVLPEIGESGQERLKESAVAIIGMGALGSVAAELLTRAGIGSLLLVDYDVVELSNLQRQALYDENDIGILKVTAAAQHLKSINRETNIREIPKLLNLTTISLLQDVDLILDCTDNLQTRFLLNEFSMKEKIPFIYCGAVETRGMVYVINPMKKERACFNCIFDKLKSVENCEDFGVLNTTTHLAATLQVGEAMKILLGKEHTDGVISFNAGDLRFDIFSVKKNNECRVCQGTYHMLSGKTPLLDFCTTKRCVKVRPLRDIQIDFEHIKKIPGIKIKEENGTSLRVLLDNHELLIFANGMIEFFDTRNQDVAKELMEKLQEKK